MAWYAVLRQLVLLSLLAMPVAAYADLKSDMVKFDQAYIPALVLSGQGNPLSALAMDSLLNRWDWFKQRQAYRPDRDTQWNFDLATIERAILTAKRRVDEGAYAEAHVTLKGVRISFMHMRQRIGMAYLPDALTDFHQSLEAMLELMVEGADAADVDALRLNYQRASAHWEAALDWPVNPFDYGLNSSEGDLLRRQMLDESSLLKRLGQQLAAGDHTAMGSTVTEIKDCFIRVYSHFGRFPQPPQTTAAH